MYAMDYIPHFEHRSDARHSRRSVRRTESARPDPDGDRIDDESSQRDGTSPPWRFHDFSD
jgi:hypothetical protein